jgi:hypothetical protein
MTLIYVSLAGEVCQEWQRWGDYFHIKSILGNSLLQSSIYVILAVRISHPSARIFIQAAFIYIGRFCRKLCIASCNIRTTVSCPKIIADESLISLILKRLPHRESVSSFCSDEPLC